MQRKLSFRKSEDGVSPIIGTILILGIMVTITGTMLVWGIPQTGGAMRNCIDHVTEVPPPFLSKMWR